MDDRQEAATWQQTAWRGMRVIIFSLRPLILYLTLPAVLMCVGMALGRGRHGESIVSTSGNFYYTMGIGASCWLLYRRSKKRGSSLWEDATLFWEGRDPRKLWRLWGAGLGCSLVFSAALTLLPLPEALIQGYGSVSDGVGAGTDPWLAFLSTILLAPAVEEIVFRGYMLNRLLTGFKDQEAVWISSLAFALCHVSLVWMIYAFAMGVFLARVSLREDNILYSAALHMGFNASVLPLWILNEIGIFEQGWAGMCGKLTVGIGGGVLVYTLCRQYGKEKPYD